MAGPGPISRHYALSAAPDTSKMGTFPSDPPLAPAKMWIQLLNTGIGISNERQLGGGTIYQGLKHLWRAAEKWKSFSPQSPVHCWTTLNNSISGGLGHSFFAPDVHQPRHPTWSHWGAGWRVVSTDRYKNQAAFYQSETVLFLVLLPWKYETGMADLCHIVHSFFSCL